MKRLLAPSLVSSALLASGLAASSPAPAATSATELSRSRAFPEGLLPVGGEPSAEENAALAAALREPAGPARRAAVDAFITARPTSSWLPALLLNRGLLRFDEGYFSSALADWLRAWELGRKEQPSRPEAAALVTRALAEAVKMYCRVGRVAEAKALLAEFGDRACDGLNASMLDQSRKAIGQMETMPDDCFKCGPFALSSILHHQRAHTRATQTCITTYATTAQGTSLAEIERLANERLGMRMQAARRTSSQAPLLLPAVVHWKLNHYGALLESRDGRYLFADPTFGTSAWIGAEAIAEESDGYFLVPAGPLPPGWTKVTEAEAGKIWGRGDCAMGDGNGTGKGDPKTPPCGRGPGMAFWSIHTSLASLNLEDTPLVHLPPVGPAVVFRINYSQLEQNQPTTINYSNAGPLWNLSFVSSLTFDSNNARARMGDGGTELYTRFNAGTGTYDPDQSGGATLVRISATNYERRATDGSKLVFATPDGSGRIFLTQTVDPQGNALTCNYDADFRLVSVTDAIGQITALEHGSNAPGDPRFYRVTKVTDPFGRFTTLTYDASHRLSSITDPIGIVSQFSYNASSQVTKLTTPYGETNFTFGTTNAAPQGVASFVEAVEPNGARQRVESLQYSTTPATEPAAQVPTGMPTHNDYMQYRNSYYWNRQAMAEGAGDYSKAQLSHFLHLNIASIKANVLESTKAPFENRVWYAYQGQGDPIYTTEGMSAGPAFIGRVLDDGTSQVYRYTYNAQGNVTQYVDPLGRTTKYGYAANGVDLLTIKQVNAQGGDDLIGTYSWNSQHRPVTYTDATGATISYGYNARGQLTSITNPRGEAITYTYNAQGFLTEIDGPLPGLVDRSTFTYDAAGRVASVTNADGYTTAFFYDALNRLIRSNYPDGTYEELTYTLLDPTSLRDRLGRIALATYDSVRQATSTTDPLGRVIRYDWCTCGSLRELVDELGRTTRWERDLLGRPTAKIYADGSRESYSYEATTSRLASMTDPRGHTRIYRYYADDQPEAILYANPAGQPVTPSVWYTYDAAYPRGRTMTDGTGVTTFTYGAVGSGLASNANRLIEIHSTWTNSRVAFGYDEIGRVASRTIDGAAQFFQRDAAGRVNSLQNALGSFTYAYENASSRVTRVDLPNGQVSTAAYFANAGDRRLQQIRHTAPGGALLSQFDYTHDSGGRVSNWQERAGTNPPLTQTLSYDAASQLLAVNATGRNFAFTYDLASNRLTRTLNGATTSFTFNALNELQSATPALGGDKTYSWDAENRLVGIAYAGSPNTTRLIYDGAGRGVGIQEYNGATLVSEKRFVWDSYERAEERDTAGLVTRRYFPQGEQVAGTAFFYTMDHLGSVRELTDASGAVRARYEYEPFGPRTRVSGDLEATRGFTGHYLHTPSGLYLAPYRAYDPLTGRWLSRDPIEESDGLNMYAYVGNSPANATDPLGLWTRATGPSADVQLIPAAGPGATVIANSGTIWDSNGASGTYKGGSLGPAFGTMGGGGSAEVSFTTANSAREAVEGNVANLAFTGGLLGRAGISFSGGQNDDGSVWVGVGFSGGAGGGLAGSLTSGPSTFTPDPPAPAKAPPAAAPAAAGARTGGKPKAAPAPKKTPKPNPPPARKPTPRGYIPPDACKF